MNSVPFTEVGCLSIIFMIACIVLSLVFFDNYGGGHCFRGGTPSIIIIVDIVIRGGISTRFERMQFPRPRPGQTWARG